MQCSLVGQTALITGASRLVGIGAGIARRFAEAGADVAFTHWTPYDHAQYAGVRSDDPARLRGELETLGVRAVDIEIDLAPATAAAELMDGATAALGPVTILVNNAAYSTRDGWEHLDAAQLDHHYEVNVRTTALLCVEFARHLPEGRPGRIVNLISGQNVGPMPGELAYVASKGAIAAFTVSLAAELAPRQITVNAVNPGVTDTGWITPEIDRDLAPRMPFGRYGQPDDAARLITFLASDAGAWITGQLLNSEGGFTR